MNDLVYISFTSINWNTSYPMQEGNVFRSVCQSFCLRGAGDCIQGVSIQWEGVCIQREGVCIQMEGSASRGMAVCIQGWSACGGGGVGRPPTGTRKAGGTHPTAVTHSWLFVNGTCSVCFVRPLIQRRSLVFTYSPISASLYFQPDLSFLHGSN